MQRAMELAELAFSLNEVPIGCVIVYQDNIIAEGYNQRHMKRNVLYHAEIVAINAASAFIKDWRLEGCTMYVTIEPCAMCAGAILQARIPRLVYGAANPKAGACGSVIDILGSEGFNHRVEVSAGMMADEAGAIMSAFFKGFRV